MFQGTQVSSRWMPTVPFYHNSVVPDPLNRISVFQEPSTSQPIIIPCVKSWSKAGLCSAELLELC